ncbi:MAG: TetR/AcrR family transcriptional regulator, partial [bacterium]
MAPAKNNSGKDTRAKILDAAEDLILEAGATGLILDEVARRAGVSKGGLLYHFPSKADLVSG